MRGINQDSIYFDEFYEFTQKLSHQIKRLRKERKLTQEEMENFELSLRQFQRIEGGETSNVTLSNLYKIAKAFQVQLSELLDL